MTKPISPTSEAAPFCGLTDLEEDIQELISECAPRRFAVLAEWGGDEEEPDAYVAAWGLAYPDGSAQVFDESGRRYFSLRSPDRAAWWFTRITGGEVRLVWLDNAWKSH